MIQSVLTFIVTTFLGFLSGLGVGGGNLLFLWLTMVERFPDADAKLINLIFFLPAALIASIFHWKRGQLIPRIILLPAVFGCLAAAVSSSYSYSFDQSLLRKFFGLLLILSAIKELTWKQKR